jgi:hypothetical protein
MLYGGEDNAYIPFLALSATRVCKLGTNVTLNGTTLLPTIPQLLENEKNRVQGFRAFEGRKRSNRY